MKSAAWGVWGRAGGVGSPQGIMLCVDSIHTQGIKCTYSIVSMIKGGGIVGNKIRINISIDENILRSLDYFANLNGMNRSSYITKLITDVMWESDDYYRSNALPQESSWITE